MKFSPSKTGTPLIANFVITSVMGLWSFWYFWTRTPPLTLENLVCAFSYSPANVQENVRVDTQGRHIILYCASYMLADLPMLYFEVQASQT